MKKKMLFLCLLCFFMITGCDVNYELAIDNDTFKENITMTFSKLDIDDEGIAVYKNNKTPISMNENEDKFYDVIVNELNDSYDLIYRYDHDLSSFKNSYFLANCYPDFDVQSNDKEITLYSGNRFMCFEGDDGLQADSVKINITTDLKVLENNADYVTGNTYTWTIDHNNYENKLIDIRLQKDVTLKETIENLNVESNASYMSLIIVGVILIIAIIIFVFVRHKRKKNNNI